MANDKPFLIVSNLFHQFHHIYPVEGHFSLQKSIFQQSLHLTIASQYVYPPLESKFTLRIGHVSKRGTLHQLVICQNKVSNYDWEFGQL